MSTTSRASRTSRAARTRLTVTPSVTTLRRGGHRSVSVGPAGAAYDVPSGIFDGLIRSARGVRLDRSR